MSKGIATAPKQPGYWEPICPSGFECFVIEGLSAGDVDWRKLGVTFFGEEAAAIVDHFKSQGKKARYRKYIPQRGNKKAKR